MTLPSLPPVNNRLFSALCPNTDKGPLCTCQALPIEPLIICIIFPRYVPATKFVLLNDAHEINGSDFKVSLEFFPSSRRRFGKVTRLLRILHPLKSQILQCRLPILMNCLSCPSKKHESSTFFLSTFAEHIRRSCSQSYIARERSSSRPYVSRYFPDGEKRTSLIARMWNPFRFASTSLVSTSQTKISIILDFPFIAIWPVAAIPREGCRSNDITSSSCSLKKVCVFVL